MENMPQLSSHQSLILKIILTHRPKIMDYFLAVVIAIFFLSLSRLSSGFSWGFVYVWPLAGTMVAAILLGRRSALICSIISALGLDYWVLGGNHGYFDPIIIVRLLTFLIITLFLSKTASELRKGYLRAENLNDQIEKESAARKHVVDIVSHDLRNPLASVQLYTSLLLKNADTPSDKIDNVEFLNGILRSAEKMKRITSDLLDASQIEMGHFSIKVASEDLTSIINDALSAFQESIRNRNIRFEVKTFEPEFHFIADRSRITQIISNLVSNAITHSPTRGVITILAEKNNESLNISVSDQGPGISAENLKHIFTRYWTEPGSTDHQGTGLGLFIAQGIATSHRGSLSVANNPKGGATFTLKIPLDMEKNVRVA